MEEEGGTRPLFTWSPPPSGPMGQGKTAFEDNFGWDALSVSYGASLFKTALKTIFIGHPAAYE